MPTTGRRILAAFLICNRVAVLHAVSESERAARPNPVGLLRWRGQSDTHLARLFLCTVLALNWVFFVRHRRRERLQRAT